MKDKVKTTTTQGETSKAAPAKVGLLLNDSRAFQGYTLIAPMFSKTTYLIDMEGKVVRTWESDCTPGVSAYLLESGHLLRPGAHQPTPSGFGPGAGGRVQEFDWDGQLLWDFKYVSETRLPHHDVTKLPNGNVLMVVWEKKTKEEVLAAGRRPELVGNAGLHPDYLIEVKPTGKTTGEIVWEWHLWDHLVQDHDRSKPNFGNVADHPELVDLNFGAGEGPIAPMMATKDGVAKLRSLGYLGSTPDAVGAKMRPSPTRKSPRQSRRKNPSPSRPKAKVQVEVGAGPRPAEQECRLDPLQRRRLQPRSRPDRGERARVQRDLDHRPQHDDGRSRQPQGRPQRQGGRPPLPMGQPACVSERLEDGPTPVQPAQCPLDPRRASRAKGTYSSSTTAAAGRAGDSSSVDEIVLPVDSQGQYTRNRRGPYGPIKAVWSYSAPKKSDFYSFFISGRTAASQRQHADLLRCQRHDLRGDAG